MKKIIYSLFVCLTLVFVSCEDKTSYDDSQITFYVNFEMLGDKTMLVPVGTQFVEPGVTATDKGKDITSSIVKTGTVNSNVVGLYPITYSAVNVDGYTSSVTRTVIVCDPSVTTDISGTDTVADSSYRLALSNGTKIPYSGYLVEITKIAPGFFSVSDFFGAFYDQYRGLKSAYRMTGYIQLKPDNTIKLLSSKVASWGDSLDKLENGVYNPTNNTIHWEATYAGAYTFFVDLYK